MPERKYDVVLYGASGFTGRQTVEYFARNTRPSEVRWAIAGRNRQALEAARAQAGENARAGRHTDSRRARPAGRGRHRVADAHPADHGRAVFSLWQQDRGCLRTLQDALC